MAVMKNIFVPVIKTVIQKTFNVMGVIYSVCCPSCGSKFEEFAGAGFMACPTCGMTPGVDDPFFCPVCGKKIEPCSESFNSYGEVVGYWD